MSGLIWILPVISAAIGWITNYVAIKMLFRPRKPINILGIQIQGVFPRRKATLAKRLGGIVARDLFNPEMIVSKIDTEENKEQIKNSIMTKVDEFINEKLQSAAGMLAMFGGDKLIAQLKDKLSEMVDDMMPELMSMTTKKIEAIDIEQMVTDKVMNFSDQKFEDLLMSVIKKELTFIEVMGAVLGFIIGLVQVGIVYFLPA